MSSFKELFNKEKDNKPVVDKTISDEILEFCREIYSQNQTLRPEDLFMVSSESYLNKAMTEISKRIADSQVYILEEIVEKFPTKDINTEKEEDSNT